MGNAGLMYNSEIKERYLEEKKFESHDNSMNTRVQFIRCAEKEFELGKDVSNWTLYEIKEYYKLMNVSSNYTLKNINSRFSMYTQFCLSNNLVVDNQNHYLEFDDDMIMDCLNKSLINKRILDKETVYRLIDELPNARDQFILLSYFEFGRSKDNVDVVNARPEDVDGNTLKLPTREVEISDKMIAVINDCMEEEKYFSITGKEKKSVLLEDNGYIVKNYPNQKSNSAFQRGRNVYMACKRAFEYLGVPWLNANAFMESGKICMVKKRSEELGVSPKEYIYSDHKLELENQYDFKLVPSTFYRKYKDYLG